MDGTIQQLRVEADYCLAVILNISVNSISALTAYRVLHRNREEMSIKFTVRITRPLEWRFSARVPS